MVGRRIGSWILEKELGRGGMGAVFEAHHASLPRRAAVKVLSPGLESEETFRQRFQREAQLQAQLKHPNVAHVLDYLEDGGQWFLVIDYIERGSLGDLLARREKVSRQQAIAWARQALSGLQHAPADGTIQRTSFFVPAAPANPTRPSPSGAGDPKRRSFQYRMMAGAATILLIAAAFAMHLSGSKTVLPAPPVSTATGTSGTVVNVTGTTASSTSTSPADSTARSNQGATAMTTHAGESPRPVTPHRTVDSAGMVGVPHPPQPFANAIPPSSQPPHLLLPAVPQIAVIGMGGAPTLAAASEQELERRLRDDYRVVDEHGTPEVDALLAKKDVQTATLGAQLLKSGFHVLLVIRVESGDHHSVHFQGQEASLKSARRSEPRRAVSACRRAGPSSSQQIWRRSIGRHRIQPSPIFRAAIVPKRRPTWPYWSRASWCF